MLDIKRGIMLNLYHESIGMWARATIKNVNMLDSLTGTGIVAFDRVRNLTWKDYKPIAEGRSVIEPHTGNVDTIQMPINSMMYIAQELPETDLIRLKNDPAIRATLIGSMTRTLAASLDGELFELLIAAAAAKKGNVIEMDIPRYVDPIKSNLYLKFAYIGNEIEQTVNQYYIGINKREIAMMVSPDMHSQLIRGVPGNVVVDKKVLDWIQDDRLTPSFVAGLYLIRHPFLGIKLPRVATNTFGHYDFTGVKAIIHHVSAAWLQVVFNNTNGVINKDTGNYRMIQRVVWGKGLVYGDLIRVIKEPSNPGNAFDWEKNLVENRDVFNHSFGFRDWELEIPASVENLQKNYRKDVK